MTTKLDPFDGTIEVRVVLHVKVDPRAWAQDMMGVHPDEVLHRDVRDDVKNWAHGAVIYATTEKATHNEMDEPPVSSVVLETPYRRS